uniref:Uncharacterized protein n=1 Tax=Rhizophora mucronata TaxID=61149 RepID=A0A2P2JT89_RHIMU
MQSGSNPSCPIQLLNLREIPINSQPGDINLNYITQDHFVCPLNP